VPYTLLQAIADLSEGELRRGLTHLQAAEFLYEASLFPELEYTFKHALTHDVAYGSLLQERRRALHARIAEAMERLYADRLAEQVDRLAHHTVRGEVWEKAVTYLHQAGARAFVRSANVEAVSLLTTGLGLVENLPPGRERLQREFDLQAALGPALMATRGFAAPEVGQAYTRARELAERLESPHLFRALYGLFRFRLIRAELKTARELGTELLPLAQAAGDRGLFVIAHRALGNSLCLLGEMAQAREHLEQGSALYDPEPHRSLAFLYGDDPGVDCLSYGALALWWLGYPDQALARVNDAVSLARKLVHPFSLARALWFATWIHYFRGNWGKAQEEAKAVIDLSRERAFAIWEPAGMMLLGGALAHQGQPEEGIQTMRRGLTAYRATGAEVVRPYLLSLLAERYRSARKPEEGLTVLAEALALVEKTDERWCEAELYRLRGELLLRQAIPAAEEAEACFRQALDTSRRQGSKSLELRAATSLSHLLHSQGRGGEARPLLAEAYDWFTEGFDTLDLQEAKALLEAL
jgi:predicted ATPase